MNIDIVSRDKRYFYLNDFLCYDGYNSRVCQPNEVDFPSVLILSVRDELTEAELEKIFAKTSADTIILSGNEKRIKKYFTGKVIDYSKNEDFLEKNAYLTAEAMLSVWHSKLEESPTGKSILISGYGRIGKHLARIFSGLGAKVYIYARRSEVREEIKNDGYTPELLDFSRNVDVIFNTAPARIFSSENISKIPLGTHIFDLASVCGFEDEDRVNFALGLPGKILPKGAAKVIYDTILPFLLQERTI